MRRQSESQIIGRAGERWFSSILPSAWSIQRPIDDFGSDGIISIGNKTSMTNLEFGVQIKSKKSAEWNDNKSRISITRDMARYFSGKFYPTLFVLYDQRHNSGYFQ
jgi:Domain of unknown function (DUF4365)